MALDGIQSVRCEDIQGGQISVGFTVMDHTLLPKELQGALDTLTREGCTVETTDISATLPDHIRFATRINVQGPLGIVNEVLTKIGLIMPEDKNQPHSGSAPFRPNTPVETLDYVL